MILCGDVMHVDSIKVFLEEFCHPNHRGVDDLRLPTIILLCPHPPSTELEHLLEVMMYVAIHCVTILDCNYRKNTF